MKVSHSVKIISNALRNRVKVWLDYSPSGIPIVVYDDNEFEFLNHPNPPVKRPDNLRAATAIEINGLLTATIPLDICADEVDLIPLVYHECFHVYQAKNFRFTGNYNFFEALAFYPELNPKYRALCVAESEVLNKSDLSPAAKICYLTQLRGLRHQILSKRANLLAFEHDLELREGIASFIEQKARAEIFDVWPDNLTTHFSYARQYQIGAAFGWLLDEVSTSSAWQKTIESGSTLAESATPFILGQQVDLSDLQLPQKEAEQYVKSKGVLVLANRQIEELFKVGAITIKIPDQMRLARSFNPSSVISLGDGRLIYPNGAGFYFPDNGKLEAVGVMVLEDFSAGEISFPSCPYEYFHGKIRVKIAQLEIELENVEERSERFFELRL